MQLIWAGFGFAVAVMFAAFFIQDLRDWLNNKRPWWQKNMPPR